jgi:hypothetical protein
MGGHILWMTTRPAPTGWGMDIPYHRLFGAFGEFWENFFTWWLMWTFNPASTMRRSMFNLQRTEFWMSRRAFIEKYD